MGTILLVGEDKTLLTTRGAVLRKTGAETFCANGASALAIQGAAQCDVMVLCHSLREKDRAALVEAVQRCWPRTRILHVVPWNAPIDAGICGSVDCVRSPEPRRLIERTAELLRLAEAATDKAAMH